MSKRRRTRTLADEIAELVTPAPRDVDPEALEYDEIDEDFLDDEDEAPVAADSTLRLRGDLDLDAAYAGKAVTRKDLEEKWTDEDERSESEEEEEEEEGEEEEEEEEETRKSSSYHDAIEAELRELEEEERDTLREIASRGAGEAIQGRQARNQKALWEEFLEIRICAQKLLGMANRMPQADTHEEFRAQEGGTEAFGTATSAIQRVLDTLLDLRDELIQQNDDIRTVLGTQKRSRACSSDYWEDIDQTFNQFKPYCDNVINKWNRKMMLSSAALMQKKFKSVNQTILAQIEHILANRDRLVKRTQLNRSHVRVLGKVPCDPDPRASLDITQGEPNVTVDDYDAEIFDDSDFYHTLLRDLIDSGTTGKEDSIELSRQWLKAQQLRIKTKRKAVDRRASKGRKIRYVVLPKLVNFMTPVEKGDHVMADRLFSRLFGGGDR